LSVKQRTDTGRLGGGATRKLKYRKLGIAASTEMDWKDKLVEDSELHQKLAQDLRWANFKAGMGHSSPEDIRQSQQAASVLKASIGKHRKTKVRSRRHASQSDKGKHIKPAYTERAPQRGATTRIAASTEMDWKDKLVEVVTPKVDVSPKGIQRSKKTRQATAADIKTVHSKKPFELYDLVHPAIRPGDVVSGGKLVGGETAKERIHSRKVDAAKKRIKARDVETSEREHVAGGGRTSVQRESPLKTRVALGKIQHEKLVALAKKKADKEVVAASTELDWTHKLVEHLIVEKDWIQGAVNPAHKGYCTPMTKKTCTPARKALAKRFKKAGRKEKKSGGTGWEGKV